MNKRIFFFVCMLISGLCGFSQQSWYEVKSGIIRSRVNAGGIILQQTEYFDNWGNSITVESIMGEKEHALKTSTVYGDKFLTMIKWEKQEGVRIPRTRPRINWLNIDSVTEKAFQIRYLGRVMLKGYKCELYKFIIKDNGREEEATNWVYKGVPIQYTTVNNGVRMVQELISFEENVSVDNSVFDIPDSITIKDL